jgi:NNP family nitrate/nitrite transporter-like MFS transporter
MGSETDWRTVCIVPVCVGFLTGFTILRISDDCPKGHYKEMKANGIMTSYNTWIFFIQYAHCFGVKVRMNNVAASYFKEEFGLPAAESAAAIASIYKWMNLFARGLDGFISNKFNANMGMSGRLIWQMVCLAIGGHGFDLCQQQESF